MSTAVVEVTTSATSVKPAWREGLAQRGVFAVSFVVFLAIAVVGQLLAMHWRTWLPGSEGGKSMIGGVKDAVYTFMSHIP